MPDAPEGGNNNSGDTPAADEFTPITTQDELNAALKDRLARERAKFSDYNDLKAKAAKLDEIENANRTEAEKATAKITELETQLNTMRVESTRLRIAAEHGITDADDIRLFLTGSDEDTLTAQAKRLADRDADRKKRGNQSSREGTTPRVTADEERTAVRSLFGSGD